MLRRHIKDKGNGNPSSNNNNNKQIKLDANVKIYSFGREQVKNLEDFYNLPRHKKILHLVDAGRNLVVDAGLVQIASLMAGTSTAAFGYCGVGGSTTAAAAGQTDLQAPIARIATTSNYTVSGEAHFDTFWSSGQGNGTWNETGIFTAASGGLMLCRKTLGTPFTKSTSNTSVVAWTVALEAVP